MAVTAFSGPILPYGVGGEANPSLFGYGVGLLDPRFGYSPGQNYTTPILGWYGGDEFVLVDQVPSTLNNTKIGTTAAPVAGTALTLVSSTGSGITVLPAGTLIPSPTGGNLSLPSTTLAIDGAVATISYSTLNGIQVYDPRTMVARCVTAASTGNDSSGTLLISGYDLYGLPMTQLLTLSNASVATTTKAFKYIVSAVPGGTISGSQITLGVADVYEFPMLVSLWPYVEIDWNSALITATTGFTAAVTTSPSTNVLGDVRGTYATQSASDGTKRLWIAVTPAPYNYAAANLVGVTQV